MPYTISMRTVLATCSLLSLAPQALAHMEMSWPYPLHSKFDPSNSYTVIDYSMTAPLFADGSNYPCKGYQNDRPAKSRATFEAGHTYNMTIAGSASHGGGSCQLSLSYDNGATFRVIKSMIGGCPLTSQYDFTIPSYAPGGNALFAWTWQNLQGNREYYMNCAVVDVVQSNANKRGAQSFEDLPYIWKANLPGINTCTTTENVTPVYPQPGPDVIYGIGATSSSKASSEPGVCDAATPFGRTYKDLGDTDSPSTGGGSPSSKSVSTQPKTTSATTLVTSSKPPTTLATTPSKSTSASTPAASSSSKVVTPSTVGPGSDTTSCPPDVTLTVYVDGSVTSTATASGFTTSKVPGAGSTVGTVATLTGPSVSTVLGFSTARSSTVLVVSAPTSKTATTATAATSSGPGPQVTEGSYATGDLLTYLPCVPGTYICTSNTTWVTCDQTMYSDGSTAWVYEASRSVGPGMACYPNFSPYSSATNKYAQQADAPAGYYRDDRITSSQMYGTCSVQGSIKCSSGGSEFLLCDGRIFVNMGTTAPGTTCVNGAIVTSS